ncbi:MAG: hypothetical protein M0D57_08680 [Sphingobacteriales bacterium JAD_PAG50586_3]|nr:MAG: hypothetical protein M0D57_08680 [Sphingobacteriales bacterium JAD_PAG50586_3]
MTISNSSAINYGSILFADERLCLVEPVSAVPFEVLPSGPSTTFTYQWYSQAGIVNCPTGSNTAGWTPISGATSSTFPGAGNYGVTTTFACLVMATGPCGSGVQWASGCRHVEVLTPIVNGGTIEAGDQSVCYMVDPNIINFSIPPSAPEATITYNWYYANNVVGCPTGNQTWGTSLGVTTPFYDPAPSTQSRTYACLITANGVCLTNSSVWANSCRKISVANYPVAGTITGGNQTFCAVGDPANITLLVQPANGSGVNTLQWFYKNGIVPAPSGSDTTGWTLIP